MWKRMGKEQQNRHGQTHTIAHGLSQGACHRGGHRARLRGVLRACSWKQGVQTARLEADLSVGQGVRYEMLFIVAGT